MRHFNSLIGLIGRPLPLCGSLIGLVLLMGGCQSPVEAGVTNALEGESAIEEFLVPPVGPVRAQAHIRLSASSLASSQPQPVGDRVSVDAVRDLFISVDWTAVDGRHLAKLEVRTPTGDLFDSLPVPFDTQRHVIKEVRWHGGPPHGVAVVKGQPQGYARTRHVVPVAGTAISQMSLKGTWSFAAFLDGEEKPRASTTLVIQ